MRYKDGFKNIYKLFINTFNWIADLIPQSDNAVSIGSDTIGIKKLHLATNFLLQQETSARLELRTSADDDYQDLDLRALYLNNRLALSESGSGIVIGNTEEVAQLSSITTAQKLALTEIAGMMTYDGELNLFQVVRDGTNWENPGTKEKIWGIHAEDAELSYAVHSLVGALTDNFTGNFPHDFNAIISMVLVVIPKQDNIDLSWTTHNANAGEAANTHTDAGLISTISVTDTIHDVDISGEFATALANDYFGLEVTGNAGHTYKILGIKLRYR